MYNCPLTPEDSVRSDHIYGTDRSLIQGGMKRHKSQDLKMPRTPLSADILLHDKYIEMCMDFFISTECLSCIQNNPRLIYS